MSGANGIVQLTAAALTELALRGGGATRRAEQPAEATQVDAINNDWVNSVRFYCLKHQYVARARKFHCIS